MTQIIILKGCFCTIYAPIDSFTSEVFIDYLLYTKRLVRCWGPVELQIHEFHFK